MELKDKQTLKNYLLGRSTDSEIAEHIELHLFSDDAFANQLAVAEDALIEEYLENALNEDEKRDFEKIFLAAPQRREQLSFTMQLRDLSAKSFTARSHKSKFWSKIGSIFTLPRLGFAAAILIALVGGAFIISNLTKTSSYENGIAAMNTAFEGERPFEMRTSGMSYSPIASTRGGDPKANNLQRDKAQSLLSEAASSENSSRAYAALGKFFLLQNNLSKAEDYLNKAFAIDNSNPQLLNDLGALYLRKQQRTPEQDGSRIEMIDKSIGYLERAIEIDPKFPEARFNYALAIEAAKMPSGAIRAWRDYLQIDGTSSWAEEARKHLEMLDAKKPLDLSAKKIEAAFLTAIDNNDEPAALQLIRSKREMISETYLPIIFSRSLVNADPNERARLVRALDLAAELELRHHGDRMPLRFAQFYKDLQPRDLEKIRQAHAALSRGFEFGKDADWKKSRPEIEKAQKIFDDLGNKFESSLCRFYLGYMQYSQLDIAGAKTTLEPLIEAATRDQFKWHLADIEYWYAAILRNENQLSQSQKLSAKVVELAESINDPTLIQKSYNLSARQKIFFGQNKQAFAALEKVFASSLDNPSSLRQKWRNYSDGTEVLAKSGLMAYAKAVSRENIELSKAMKYRLYQTYAEIDAGMIYLYDNDIDQARHLFTLALENAKATEDPQERKDLELRCLIQLGNVENRDGNYQAALANFSQAQLRIDEEKQKSFYFETIKGSLIARSNLSGYQHLDQDINDALEAAEKYRSYISKEDERSSFFDNQQSIYDIAINYYFRNDNPEKAFHTLEISNSRSLLNWVKRGSSSQKVRDDIDGSFRQDSSSVLGLAAIKGSLAKDVQILQYAVLPDQIIIWLINSEKIASKKVLIDQRDLSALVNKTTDLLISPTSDRAELNQSTKRLYQFLIEPLTSDLSADKKLVIVPNKMLFRVAFAALIDKENVPLASKFELLYSPSSNVYLHCTKNAEIKSGFASENFVGIGNPSFDLAQFSDLESLPDAEIEVDEIGRHYENKKILKKDAATADAFLEEIDDAEIIHFAGHYLVSHVSPLNSGLLLASTTGNDRESRVTNEELIKHQMPKAKLVLLSACQTGVEHYYNGEGLVGLSRTFMAAGVPLVIASHWKVDTAATADLMKKFHFYRRQEKMSSVAALRRVQNDMISSPDGKYAHPYYWAAFAAFGGKANY